MADRKKLPHLFLKSKAERLEGFKKTRGRDNKPAVEGEEEKEKNYMPMKDRLRTSDQTFKAERATRHQKRSLEIPDHIDQIKIKFFKVFNAGLKNQFIARYGLQPLAYSDFNKTILFAIDDDNLFAKFERNMAEFYNSPGNEYYKDQRSNLMTLVYNFEFISSRKMLEAYDDSQVAVQLIQPYSLKASRIYDTLIGYLQQAKIRYQHEQESNALELTNISKQQIDLILDNFDIVHSVQSTKAGKIRPGRLGNVIRDFGIEIIPSNRAPLVGIIDTGVQNIQPLRPIMADFNYDLTNTSATWDSNGHGTMVAGLVALGLEYFTDVKQRYISKATLVPIKVLLDSEGNFSHAELINTIDMAYQRGVRLFNLSINQWHKAYNASFSNYAYLLDQLTYKNDILIFISCGNIDEAHVGELYETAHASHTYPNYFYCLNTDSPFHRCETTNICVPSESLNNMTVGALAENYFDENNSGITPAKEYPASYTRKFHIDYQQQINGTEFTKNQKNKNLTKPDLVFAGGDLQDVNAGLEVFSVTAGQFYTRNAGTSLSTPLITSLAAEILGNYPSLKTQSVKALLINASTSACGPKPPDFNEKGLLRKLIGYGTPDRDTVLFSHENAITFVIEDSISSEEFKVIKLTLPEYLNPDKHASKHRLKITGTLCYKFLPIKDNHLSYCPLHISFGLFKSGIDGMNMKNTEEYRIKNGISWSEDFFGIENRLLSNVQKIEYNLQPGDISTVNNQLSIALRCTHKHEIDPAILADLSTRTHEFSLVITLTELPDNGINQNRLYAELETINTVEAIGVIMPDVNIDLDA